MQLPDAPAALDELRRQPVEQRGIGRQLAARAEVVGSPHDPPSKVQLPDAVDKHARCQRIRGAGDPAGQLQPATAHLMRVDEWCEAARGIRLSRLHDSQGPARNHFSQSEAISSQVDAEIARLRLFRGHDHQRFDACSLRNRELPPHRGVADLVLKRFRAAEDSRQSVIVRRTNGVELVIVAAGTGQRQSEHRAAGHIDLIVHNVEP